MTWVLQTIFQWLDLLWVPLLYFAAHKGQKMAAAAFALLCIFGLRLQVELITDIGYPTGIMPFMHSPILQRGMATYAFFIIGFLILSRFSKGTDGFLYLASGLTIFIIGFCVSSIVMVL